MIQSHMSNDVTSVSTISHPSGMTLITIEKWGIDFIGTVSPTSSKKLHIIITSGYCKNWAEDKVSRKSDARTMTPFLYKNMVVCFMFPLLLSYMASIFLTMLWHTF